MKLSLMAIKPLLMTVKIKDGTARALCHYASVPADKKLCSSRQAGALVINNKSNVPWYYLPVLTYDDVRFKMANSNQIISPKASVIGLPVIIKTFR